MIAVTEKRQDVASPAYPWWPSLAALVVVSALHYAAWEASTSVAVLAKTPLGRGMLGPVLRTHHVGDALFVFFDAVALLLVLAVAPRLARTPLADLGVRWRGWTTVAEVAAGTGTAFVVLLFTVGSLATLGAILHAPHVAHPHHIAGSSAFRVFTGVLLAASYGAALCGLWRPVLATRMPAWITLILASTMTDPFVFVNASLFGIFALEALVTGAFAVSRRSWWPALSHKVAFYAMIMTLESGM